MNVSTHATFLFFSPVPSGALKRLAFVQGKEANQVRPDKHRHPFDARLIGANIEPTPRSDTLVVVLVKDLHDRREDILASGGVF